MAASGRGTTAYVIMDPRHKCLGTIGQGVSGVVQRYQLKDKAYVVKTYHRKEDYESRREYRDRVLAEYFVLQKLDNLHVIKAYKFKTSIFGSLVHIYLEAGENDLRELRRRKLPPQKALCLWKQLCAGVEYIHGQGLCHRDLKLENLVMVGSTLKIIDFATACEPAAVGLVGSPQYAAPETFSSIKYDGQKADVWLVGILLYVFMNGDFPWESAHHDDKDFRQYVDHGVVDVPVPKTLTVDPIARWIITDVTNNGWYRGIECCGDGVCQVHGDR